MPKQNYRIVLWDWREQPDWDEINRAIKELNDPKVRIREVNTQSDMFAVVIGDLTPKVAQCIFEREDLP
jgi:hypothetical protein